MRVRKEHPDDDNFIIACVGKPEFPEQFRPVYMDTLGKPQSAGAGAKPTLAQVVLAGPTAESHC